MDIIRVCRTFAQVLIKQESRNALLCQTKLTTDVLKYSILVHTFQLGWVIEGYDDMSKKLRAKRRREEKEQSKHNQLIYSVFYNSETGEMGSIREPLGYPLDDLIDHLHQEIHEIQTKETR